MHNRVLLLFLLLHPPHPAGWHPGDELCNSAVLEAASERTSITVMYIAARSPIPYYQAHRKACGSSGLISNRCTMPNESNVRQTCKSLVYFIGPTSHGLADQSFADIHSTNAMLAREYDSPLMLAAACQTTQLLACHFIISSSFASFQIHIIEYTAVKSSKRAGL